MLQARASTLVKLTGLVVLLLLLGILLGRLPTKMGQIDFRAYWSASYLLARGENFAADDSLMAIQRDLTGFDTGYAMKTWNPPWVLLAWLLPYTFVEFDMAAKLWLMTNVGALLFSVVTGWQMLFPAGAGAKKWL